MPPLFKRHHRKYERHLFDDLPMKLRWEAERQLARLCDRWRGNLPGWRMAILIGRARWLAQNPPTSEWGRSMLAKRGGYAVQFIPNTSATCLTVNNRVISAPLTCYGLVQGTGESAESWGKLWESSGILEVLHRELLNWDTERVRQFLSRGRIGAGLPLEIAVCRVGIYSGFVRPVVNRPSFFAKNRHHD
jgi:hypothetical protein